MVIILPMDTLTSEESVVVTRDAFEKLSAEDKAVIRDLAKRLIRNVKRKNPDVKFGMDAALEVIACVGIAVVKRKLIRR